jgi:hypothetical protein
VPEDLGDDAETRGESVVDLKDINMLKKLHAENDPIDEPHPSTSFKLTTQKIVIVIVDPFDGAKLSREVFFNLWKYSSLVPGNGARKLAANVWLTWEQTVLVRGE